MTASATPSSSHQTSDAHVPMSRSLSVDLTHSEISLTPTAPITESENSSVFIQPTKVPSLTVSACKIPMAEPTADAYTSSLTKESSIQGNSTPPDPVASVSAPSEDSGSPQTSLSPVALTSPDVSAVQFTSSNMPFAVEDIAGAPLVDNLITATDSERARLDRPEVSHDSLCAASYLDSNANAPRSLSLSNPALELATSDQERVEMDASLTDTASRSNVEAALTSSLIAITSCTPPTLIMATDVITPECETFLPLEYCPSPRTNYPFNSANLVNSSANDDSTAIEATGASEDAVVRPDTPVELVQDSSEHCEHAAVDIITFSLPGSPGPNHIHDMSSDELLPSSLPTSQTSAHTSHQFANAYPDYYDPQPRMLIDECVEPLYEPPTPPSTFAVEFSEELCGPSSPFPSSSPLPSSSPARIFSSPPRERGYTPPSSSPPLSLGVDKDDTATQGVAMQVGSELPSVKRSYSDADGPQDDFTLERTNIYQAGDAEGTQNKRMKLDISPTPPPNPKRPTLASQQKQRQKLAAPFRSPLVDKTVSHQGVGAVYASAKAALDLRGGMKLMGKVECPPAEEKPSPYIPTIFKKDYTENAAKQFKSPLSANALTTARAGSPCGGRAFSSVTAAPTIQALQGKLQTLKQAIKLKNSGSGREDDELEELVKKWTTAGREIAWAVWDTVKDVDPGESAATFKGKGGWFDDESDFGGAKKGTKKGFDGGWGYADGGRGGLESGWGWEEKGKSKDVDVEMGEQEGIPLDDEVEVPGHTLGTMLRHLGIAPDTLGWDEDEGDFVDAV
ncbi:hypothetical protein B0H21DRAFT_712769 [Amylocystis lapponica]|nr:hypothetical protein B0H21DRAFT_712769 [Amylocystis lapponica]